MVRNTAPGRIVCSAFLLTLIVMQWCFGFMYFRQVYFVDVTQTMTAEEQDLASTIGVEYGFHPQVRVHDEIDLSYLNTLGYGAPFALQHHVRGQAITFTLNENGPVVLEGEFTVGGGLHDTADDQEARLCAERLFSPIPLPELHYFRSGISLYSVYPNPSAQNLSDLFHPDIVAPPPRLA